MYEFFEKENEFINRLSINGVRVFVGWENKKDEKGIIRISYMPCFDFSEHDKVFEDKIAELEKKNKDLESCFTQREQDSTDMIMELKQRIADLESKETESVNEMPDSITIDGYKCKIIKTESGLYISRDEIYSIIDKEKEPLKQKCKELEDRYQSDCVEINRLNTTIDVLIHKVEYLRQFAGLE